MNTAQFQVRPAKLADVKAILAIYNEAVLNTTASYDDEPQTYADRKAWFKEHARQNLPVLVAVDEKGIVVGWSSLSRFHRKPGYRFTLENSIYIGPDHRGKGIGKLLMRPLIDAARAAGYHAIIALVDSANEASVRLHASLGFDTAGRLKEVGFKFNRWLDVLYMQLTL